MLRRTIEGSNNSISLSVVALEGRSTGLIVAPRLQSNFNDRLCCILLPPHLDHLQPDTLNHISPPSFCPLSPAHIHHHDHIVGRVVHARALIRYHHLVHQDATIARLHGFFKLGKNLAPIIIRPVVQDLIKRVCACTYRMNMLIFAGLRFCGAPTHP